QKVVKLGTATSRGSEELTLEVSFATTPPTVNVTVRDFVSPAVGDPEWMSQALGCSRSIARLPAAVTVGGGSLDYSSAPGHYTLSATDQDPTGVNDAYVMVQLLSTGKLIWMSRTKGVLGTGSGGLRISSDGLSAAFYEGRLSSNSTAWKTTSLLGNLNFGVAPTPSEWSSNFGSDALPSKLEKQASYVFKSGYDDSDGQNWTGVTTLDFSDEDGARWGNTTVATVPSFLSGTGLVPLNLTLSAQDPFDLGGYTASYTWNVTVTPNGRVNATSLPDDGGVLSPRLALTLDKQRGGPSGYYMSSITGTSVRRNLYGCGLISPSDDTLRARGWVESGVLPTLSTGGWKLQRGP
ncbi:MAG: hypothetical protein WCL08_08710, partial [Verrucomicrobiota bacterium]